MSTVALKRVAIIQLAFYLLMVVTFKWWCAEFQMLNTDLCWLLSGRIDEFQRAFPNYFRWIYFIISFIKFGLPIVSVLVVAVSFMNRQLFQNLGLVLFSFLLTLLLSEFVLRVLGYRPGQFGYDKWVHPVDSLVQLRGYSTDSIGILSVDTGLVAEMTDHTQGFMDAMGLAEHDRGFTQEIFAVLRSHGVDKNQVKPSNEFWDRYSRSKQNSENVWDSMYFNYANDPINRNGFYSLPFEKKSDSIPSILLLGDSFTWGHSASDCTNSFANILLSRGWQVFNTGISGADVSQYIAILRKYGESIRPDIVICNFFMGNDVQYFERELSEKVPLNYHTNAGVIYSNHSGIPFDTAEKAYFNIIRNMVIPKTTYVNKLFSSTVISTLLWEFLVNLGMIEHQFFVGPPYPEHPITVRQIQEMQSICDVLGAELILSVIPKMENGKIHGAESIPHLFGEIPYHQPILEVSMYDKEDGHFNDEGHFVYANYLEGILLSELEKLGSDNSDLQ